MIGEINYEIIVGVIHNLLAIVLFIAVFVGGFPSSMFMGEGPYRPPFMNMLYMVGNSVCFPTSRWRMDESVTLDTGGGGGGGVVWWWGG